MDEKNYVLCGMAFGDEGKGSFVDYLVHAEDIQNIVRYNGGSQASHTVVTPDGKIHKCSQLSSGIFLDNSKIFLSNNTVINIENLVEEARCFTEKSSESIQEVLNRVYIHEECYFVTPYHRLIGRLIELSKGKEKRGSVGTGVSQVMLLLKEEGLGVKVSDINNTKVFSHKLKKIYSYLINLLDKNMESIQENIVDEIEESLHKDLNNCTNIDSVEYLCQYYQNLLKSYKLNICKNFDNYLQSQEKIIFEGSQALLIDWKYGIRPNTTCLDVTNKFALKMLQGLNKKNICKVGILKAFYSRHGQGIFPTEDDELNQKITDPNQTPSFWNGYPRYGWFDAVLTRYSQNINEVEEIFLSSIDLLDNYQKIKICNSYNYIGEIDKDFEELFEYEIEKEKIIIHNIKNNSDNLKAYLEKCIPIYKEMEGWKTDTSNIRDRSELPENCTNYINELQKMIGIKITLISVGATRENKIRIGGDK